MPPKLFKYLILVWAVVCLSGLGVFLFELYGPGSEVNSTEYLESPLTTLGFWLVMWLVPTVILLIAARRQGDGD